MNGRMRKVGGVACISSGALRSIARRGAVCAATLVALALRPALAEPPATNQLLFSVVTDSLPDSGNTGPWATYSPAGQTLATIGSPTVKKFGGVKWEQNIYRDGDGFLQARYAAPIGCTGVTIVAAVKPIHDVIGGEPRGEIVDIFYNRLGLAIGHSDGRVMVARNYWNDWGPAIPSGQTVILSLVVQTDGTYKAYTNGVEIMSGAANGDWTSINPDHTADWGSDPDFTHYVSVGRNAPDGWSVFNGYIGDVFVYRTALSDADRAALEASLIQKFVTDATLSYLIAASAAANGAIDPSGDIAAIQGYDQAFTITPDTGYQVADVLVDGVSVGAVRSYKFPDVAAPHTITATFAVAFPRTITASAGAGGSISPAGDVVLPGGQDQTFAIVPDAGYAIADVVVDGVSRGPLNAYTFSQVAAPHTIAATFVALNRNLPRTGQIIFSAVTDSFPANGESTGNRPTYVPLGQTLWMIANPTAEDDAVLPAVKWEKNLYAEGDGYRLGSSYWDAAGQHPIPCNGASIVVAVKPVRLPVPMNWNSIVDIFYDRLVLAIDGETGELIVRRNGSLDLTGAIIPDGQTTVLSLVVQPTGAYKVYANGTQVAESTGASDMTALIPGVTGGGLNGYGTFINLGRNNPDGWTVFNGLIGDVFVYSTALTDEERIQVQDIIQARLTPQPEPGGTVLIVR